jgi:hypothetical protein
MVTDSNDERRRVTFRSVDMVNDRSLHVENAQLREEVS